MSGFQGLNYLIIPETTLLAQIYIIVYLWSLTYIVSFNSQYIVKSFTDIHKRLQFSILVRFLSCFGNRFSWTQAVHWDVVFFIYFVVEFVQNSPIKTPKVWMFFWWGEFDNKYNYLRDIGLVRYFISSHVCWVNMCVFNGT